jgi:hypothetical protein
VSRGLCCQIVFDKEIIVCCIRLVLCDIIAMNSSFIHTILGTSSILLAYLLTFFATQRVFVWVFATLVLSLTVLVVVLNLVVLVLVVAFTVLLPSLSCGLVMLAVVENMANYSRYSCLFRCKDDGWKNVKYYCGKDCQGY